MKPTTNSASFWLQTFVFLFLGLSAHAEFSISGNISQLDPGAKLLFLRQDLETGIPVNEGELVVQSDHSFEQVFDTEAGLFHLAVPGQGTVPLAIAAGQKLNIASDPNMPGGFLVSGSPDTGLLLAYEAFRKDSLARLVYPPRAELNEATALQSPPEKLAALAQAEVDSYQAHRRELTDFTIEKIRTSVALYATSSRWDPDYRLDELQGLVNEFASKYPALAVTRHMQERLQRFHSTAIGSKAPPLEGASLDEELVSLDDFQGKVVLVDFWASWCVPCRVENQLYPGVLDRYSDKEFQVLGINLDTDRMTWTRASRQDSVTWPQISDLLGLESPMAKAYNVSALPASFLLDQSGQIIGKNLRGEALAKKLEELFEDR